MKLVPRSEWGARPPKRTTAIHEPVRGVTLHWVGTPLGTFPHTECPEKIRAVQNFHMDTKTWADIAYNALVCPHGDIFEGRWVGARSAGNGTNEGNNHHYAICGLFGEGDAFTEGAKSAFKDVIVFFRANGAGSEIKPHSAWKGTKCPGPAVKEWIDAGCPAPEAIFDRSDPTPTDTAVAVEAFDDGYWTFDEQGNVFREGSVPLHGSLAGVRLNAPIVKGLAHNGKSGYWMIGADGGVFAFGTAPVIHPYEPLMQEYRDGQRRIVDATNQGDSLILLSNLGERYRL